ncbi:MAG: thermonuclease family protein [Rhodocyclales bacterium]|nr:thermonuclease family protein [Rhodocyclales bacterium]
MNRCLLLLFCLLVGITGVVRAETLGGHVDAVVDGDTLRVDVPGRGQLQVRVAWIDAPARLQEQGEAARSSLGALAFGRAVLLENPQQSGHEWRAVVRVAPPGGRCGNADCPPTLDLGLAQVERGMAWHDQRSPGQPAAALADYQQAEFTAKIRRLGLWAGKNPLPPWEWRGPR